MKDKEKKLKNSAAHVFLACGCITIIIASFLLAYNVFEQNRANHYYEAIKSITTELMNTETEKMDCLDSIATETSEVDLDSVKSLNYDSEEFENWLIIDNTTISYPVMQGENNSYYLRHLPNGEYNRAGSIFLNYSSKVTDFNLVIYGHNMKNNTMFGTLDLYYTEPDYAETHNTMSLKIDNEYRKYKLFSIHKTRYDSYAYELNPVNEIEWISRHSVDSIWDSGLKPESNSRFVTLSTCGNTDEEKLVLVWLEI